MERQNGGSHGPDDLTDEDILAMPLDSFPRSMLAEAWSRHAGIRLDRDLAQITRELTDETYVGPRRFTAVTAADRRRMVERESREFLALQARARFEQTMADIRERSDDLLRRIDEQEQLAIERMAQVRKRAIVLSDGRRAYVGDDGAYVEEQGGVLAADDAAEAHAQHALQPTAATWKEKTAADLHCEELRRMKQEVTDFREQIGREKADGLSDEQLDGLAKKHETTLAVHEARFHAKFELVPGASAGDYGSADYMAAYTTSFASSLDPKRSGLKDEFRPAAAGQESTEAAPQRLAPTPRGPSL